MRPYERAAGLLAGVLGILVWVVPVEGGGQPWYLGPALFPRLVGLVILAAGVACWVGGRREESGEVGKGRWTGVGLVMGALLAAPALVERVGLTATAVLLTGLGAWSLGAGVRGGLVAAMVVGLLVRLVFVGLLGVGR